MQGGQRHSRTVHTATGENEARTAPRASLAVLGCAAEWLHSMQERLGAGVEHPIPSSTSPSAIQGMGCKYSVLLLWLLMTRSFTPSCVLQLGHDLAFTSYNQAAITRRLLGSSYHH